MRPVSMKTALLTLKQGKTFTQFAIFRTCQPVTWYCGCATTVDRLQWTVAVGDAMDADFNTTDAIVTPVITNQQCKLPYKTIDSQIIQKPRWNSKQSTLNWCHVAEHPRKSFPIQWFISNGEYHPITFRSRHLLQSSQNLIVPFFFKPCPVNNQFEVTLET